MFSFFFVQTIASNPESSECPLNGAYSLLGPLGPPYLMSRHKRNHITNKHHHNATPFKKHDSLSFRNGETFEQTLHPHERFNNQRHRRDLSKCTGTHKLKRRLSIGCSKDSIVEVHPQCSENGDEGKCTALLLLLVTNQEFIINSLPFFCIVLRICLPWCLDRKSYNIYHCTSCWYKTWRMLNF